jgi:lysophospholipase L1-like esterase
MRTKTLVFIVMLATLTAVASCSDSASGMAYEDLPAVVDVVALGGSNVGGYGVGGTEQAYPAVYARSLAEEAGVETRCASHHTLETMQTRPLSRWNQLLATDEEMRADLEAAEVVIVELGVHTILIGCGWYTEWTVSCLSEVAASMSAEYEQLFDAIDELVVDGTIIMAFNQGLPRPTSEYWRDDPDWPAMKAEGFEVWWGGLDAAATAHNAVVIDTAHLFGDGDPDEFGIGPEYTQPDNAHLSPEGHRLFADLLLDADGIGPDT